ncbi:MAG: DMT family transporter [Aquamicrobium sp.]|nr:DMT family transporter [Aquamicrobium sp.]
MQQPGLVLLAFAAGALLSAQGPFLTRMAFHAGGPIQAATVAFAVGLCVLLAAGVLAGTGVPRLENVVRMPIWLWAGGLIGTGLLLLTLYAVPRIGVAVFAAAVVCGQLLAALAYDHVGAFGIELRRVGPREMVGTMLLLAGLVMIACGPRD